MESDVTEINIGTEVEHLKQCIEVIQAQRNAAMDQVVGLKAKLDLTSKKLGEVNKELINLKEVHNKLQEELMMLSKQQ